ncbi:MAG: hypothetical protein ABR981_02400 [Candidatus Micrarchaeaceae archaeon]|jgi:hypothetical protein
MAKKSTSNNSNNSNSQSSTSNSTQTTATKDQRSPWVYVAIAVVVILIIGIVYYVLAGGLGSPKSPSSNQILNNATNSSLNQTQLLFISDLKKSENVSNMYVSYYSNNGTNYVKQSSNLTIAITDNQTIDSYKLGNYNKTVFTDILTYRDFQNGEQIAKNVSDIYYYNTNQTVTCFNDTTYSSVLVTNSSLQCGTGDQSLSYLEESPFTAVNVSSLSYLILNSSISYSGSKTIAGRDCDDFIISNATGSNIQSNYSVFNICIDRQYGIPLYFNQTNVVGGIPSSFTFTAAVVSTNVSSSEFVIPQAYLNAIQHPII